MPTAEGVFPKNGFDPHYYSEANYMARGGGVASGLWGGIVSGAAFQTTGSVIINAGSICRDNVLLMINYRILTHAADDIYSHRFLVSGINGNFTLQVGSLAVTNNSQTTCGMAHISMDANTGFGWSHYETNDATSPHIQGDGFVVLGTFTPSGTFGIYAQTLTPRNLTSNTSGVFYVYTSPLSYNY